MTQSKKGFSEWSEIKITLPDGCEKRYVTESFVFEPSGLASGDSGSPIYQVDEDDGSPAKLLGMLFAISTERNAAIGHYQPIDCLLQDLSDELGSEPARSFSVT